MWCYPTAPATGLISTSAPSTTGPFGSLICDGLVFLYPSKWTVVIGKVISGMTVRLQSRELVSIVIINIAFILQNDDPAHAVLA